MANRIYSPYLNSLKWVPITPADIPQYVSKHMEDWLFTNTIRDFEQKVRFYQKWLFDDSIKNQFISNFGPLTLKLHKCNGEVVYQEPFETKQQDFFNPGYYIRQSELDLASLVDLEEGFYYCTIPEAKLISEPFEIVSEDTNSSYIEYWHHEEYADIIFDAPFTPAIRVPAIVEYKTPGSKDTVYEDQNYSPKMVKSVTYDIWNFILGGIGGVPPWMEQKIAKIFGCSSLKIDGRLYTKNVEAQWEPVEAEQYPMAGWAIELRSAINRDSTIIENDVLLTGKAAMMAVIDTKGFGIEDNGGDFLEIYDVE